MSSQELATTGMGLCPRTDTYFEVLRQKGIGVEEMGLGEKRTIGTVIESQRGLDVSVVNGTLSGVSPAGLSIPLGLLTWQSRSSIISLGSTRSCASLLATGNVWRLQVGPSGPQRDRCG